MSNRRRPTTSTYLSFFIVLHAMLRELGHAVDWRAVEPAEPLAGRYDLALLGLQAMNGLAGKQYRYGTLWAATQLPHAVVFDDWQVTATVRALKKSNYCWRTAMLGGRELREHEVAMRHFDLLDRVRSEWYRELPAVIAPLFAWGDHAKFERLHPMTRLVAVDPSAFVPRLTRGSSRDVKERGWVLAALGDHTDWSERLGLRWPIIRQHGQKGKRGWGRVPEERVVDELYRSHWGVLAPRYDGRVIGTGWWRSRFNFAAQAGSVLHADPLEVQPLGRSYLYRPAEVEDLNHYSLRKLASTQARALDRETHSRADALDHLKRGLKLARRDGEPIQL